MVERTQSKGLDEFEGIVESVDFESGIDDRSQYHIKIKPTNVVVKGPTGQIHEWVPMSPKATDESVPQGSVMDRYLGQLEIALTGVDRAKTVTEALAMMVGKKFRFKKLKLGKDYEGHAAKGYITPVAKL